MIVCDCDSKLRNSVTYFIIAPIQNANYTRINNKSRKRFHFGNLRHVKIETDILVYYSLLFLFSCCFNAFPS